MNPKHRYSWIPSIGKGVAALLMVQGPQSPLPADHPRRYKEQLRPLSVHLTPAQLLPRQRRTEGIQLEEFGSYTVGLWKPFEPHQDCSPQGESGVVLALAGTSRAWPMLGVGSGGQFCDCGEVPWPGIWGGQSSTTYAKKWKAWNNGTLPPELLSAYGRHWIRSVSLFWSRPPRPLQFFSWLCLLPYESAPPLLPFSGTCWPAQVVVLCAPWGTQGLRVRTPGSQAVKWNHNWHQHEAHGCSLAEGNSPATFSVTITCFCVTPQGKQGGKPARLTPL